MDQSKNLWQTNWTNNSMVECLSEELVVQVRVLLRPQIVGTWIWVDEKIKRILIFKVLLIKSIF
jgi:hypothetical protein